jgi:hypothetical protein
MFDTQHEECDLFGIPSVGYQNAFKKSIARHGLIYIIVEINRLMKHM